jgi:membrane-associated protease RseP (regulator of RpoE activity)
MSIKKNNKLPLQITLFLVTIVTTTLAGAEWSFNRMLFWTDPPMSWEDFLRGFNFSIPFLLALTVHEFGHYFASRHYKVAVTLPYYIPFWFGFIGLPSLGTMGAFIRIKEAIRSRQIFFDIGIAGPLAGFVVALGILYYGFTNLPEREYIFEIHPEYKIFGDDYEQFVYSIDTVFYKENLDYLDQATLNRLPDTIQFSSDLAITKLGKNLLFSFYEHNVAPDAELVPNPHEIIHYPWLFAGYMVLFFTAINLIPIGQLDGGHVLYGLIGYKRHRVVSLVLFIIFVFYASLGIINPHQFNDDFSYIWNLIVIIFLLYLTFYSVSSNWQNRLLLALAVLAVQMAVLYFFPLIEGYNFWMVFAFLIGRFLGVYHPPALEDRPLNTPRKILGWITLIIFIISFSPQVFVM